MVFSTELDWEQEEQEEQEQEKEEEAGGFSWELVFFLGLLGSAPPPVPTQVN